MKFNRNFYFLLIGQSVSNLGDAFYIISVISVLYNITSSATITALVPFTITTAMFVSSVLSPIILTKVSLKTLLVSSQIGKTILLFALVLFMFTFIDQYNYFFVFVLIAGIALLDGCANPIMRSLLPHYIEQSELVKANSLLESVLQTVQISSWLFGAMLLSWVGADTLILLVAFLFVISSLMFSTLTAVKNEQSENQTGLRESITQGWRTIREIPSLKTLLYIEVLETMASTVWIASILYVFVEEALQVNQQWWGFINATFFTGLLIGSLYVMKNATIVDERKYFYILLGSIFTTVCTLIFGITSIPVIALVMSGLMGLFGQIKNIPQQTIIQKVVPVDKLPTVYTSMGTLTLSMYGLMALLIGVLADFAGVRIVFLGSGLLLLIVTLIILKNKKLLI